MALACCSAGLIASLIALALATTDDRALAAPMLAIGEITLIFVSVLWSRDGAPPIFESGTLCILATSLYGTLPLLGFLLMHGDWYRHADARLFAYPFVPAEVGTFGWRYVVYTASFALAYLAIRGHASVHGTAIEIRPATALAIGIVFVALYLVKIALKVAYGYEIDVAYSESSRLAAAIERMPYVILQFAQNLVGALLVTQQGIMVLLLARWRQWWCRLALVTWLGFELVHRSLLMGSRTVLVLLVLSVAVLYHRLVKPLSFRFVALAGAALLGGFLVLGSLRDERSADPGNPPGHALMVSNEFQGLFVTAFDLYKMKETGRLRVPWQVYASDAYMFIPSQLLPFEKIEPASWYIDVIGQTGQGVGYMFGVMSQAAVGLGWIELVLRGVALAACLALFHRWYVRRAVGFWPTLFYLFMSVLTYYTFRATTLWIIYFVLYRFVPVFALATALEALMAPQPETGDDRHSVAA